MRFDSYVCGFMTVATALVTIFHPLLVGYDPNLFLLGAVATIIGFYNTIRMERQ